MPPRILKDRVASGVRVLFVGINPGLRSAATGHHFAGYSNRFWKLLHDAGLVPEPITYEDDDRLPEWGYGLTNLVPRATAGIDELTLADYRDGAKVLLKKIRRLEPEVVALVGVTVWRALLAALDEHELRRQPVKFGFQDLKIEGARVCVLPNPSGRNATLTYPEMLRAFRTLRPAAAQGPQRSSRTGRPLAPDRRSAIDDLRAEQRRDRAHRNKQA